MATPVRKVAPFFVLSWSFLFYFILFLLVFFQLISCGRGFGKALSLDGCCHPLCTQEVEGFW